MIPPDADYVLRAFAAPNRGGHLLIETWHIGDASKNMELDAMKARRARGEIGTIELVDCRKHVTSIVY